MHIGCQSILWMFYLFTAIKTTTQARVYLSLFALFLCGHFTLGKVLPSVVMLRLQCRCADPYWHFVILSERLSLYSTIQPSWLCLTGLSASLPKHCLESAYLATQAGETKRQISKSCRTYFLCGQIFILFITYEGCCKFDWTVQNKQPLLIILTGKGFFLSKTKHKQKE